MESIHQFGTEGKSFDTLSHLDFVHQQEAEASVAHDFYIEFLPSGAVSYIAREVSA